MQVRECDLLRTPQLLNVEYSFLSWKTGNIWNILRNQSSAEGNPASLNLILAPGVLKVF